MTFTQTVALRQTKLALNKRGTVFNYFLNKKLRKKFTSEGEKHE